MKYSQRKQMLLDKYLHDDSTPEEREELYGYLASEEDPAPYKVILQLLWEEIQAEKELPSVRAEAMFRRITAATEKPKLRLQLPVYWKAAAILLPVVALGTLLWYQMGGHQYKSAAKMTVAHRSGDKLQTGTGIVPGNSKALLILGNGKTLDLTDSTQKLIVEKDGTKVSNTASRLMYNGGQQANALHEEVSYNTLVTPRGGEYAVVLADGTKVWLNAASSLRYPTRFTGSERRVELTGEAYFEVVHNARQPFIVSVAGMEITDLGTRFDVKAYGDEPFIKTALVEGKLSVAKTGKTAQTAAVILMPGYQAVLKSDAPIQISRANLEEALAWKNGLFVFDSEPLGSIMRKLSRWYDVEVQFDNLREEELHFTGSIRKYENIDKVLHMLELTGEVKFTIAGRALQVRKK